MMNFSLKREWISLLAVALMALLSVVLYPSLPETVPIHWDVNGQPDDFAPKTLAVTLMPLAALLLYGVLYVAPALDPKRASLERSAETYILIRTVAMLFFLFVHALSLFSSLSTEATLNVQWMLIGVGLMFVVLGNYMPRLKPSWIAGIRTPWTISSDTVWSKTHRLGGKVFVIGGLLLCAAAFLPAAYTSALLFFAIAFVLVIPIAYSYWLWRQEQNSRAGQTPSG